MASLIANASDVFNAAESIYRKITRSYYDPRILIDRCNGLKNQVDELITKLEEEAKEEDLDDVTEISQEPPKLR